MKITKKQLRRIIKEEKAKILAENRIRQIIREAMTSATRPPTNPREWMAWGDGYGLDPAYDNDGQLIYYTDNASAARDAERLGADVERDRMGQHVIYTSAEMDVTRDAADDFVDAGIQAREMMKRR